MIIIKIQLRLMNKYKKFIKFLIILIRYEKSKKNLVLAIKIGEIEKEVHGLGTPEDLKYYLEN